MVRDQDLARDGTRQKNGTPSRDAFAISIPISFRPETNSDFASPFLASRDDSDSGPVPISMWKKSENQVFHSVIFCPRYFSLMQNIHVYFAVNYRIIWYGSDQSSKKRRDTVSRKLSGTRYTVEFLERESFWETLRDPLIILESSLKTYFCK